MSSNRSIATTTDASDLRSAKIRLLDELAVANPRPLPSDLYSSRRCSQLPALAGAPWLAVALAEAAYA